MFSKELNKRLCFNILHILYMYNQIFDAVKKNKRIKRHTTVKKIFTDNIRKILIDRSLQEYVEVICVCSVDEGNLSVAVTLEPKKKSEYGVMFIEKFHKIKEFIQKYDLEIAYEPKSKTYFLRNDLGSVRYDNDELIKLLYIDDMPKGLLKNRDQLL